jgi:predicted ABC-type ATPase
VRHILDQGPIMVAVAGPNGAGKTTFYHAHLAPSGLRYLDPDLIAKELRLGPEDTAQAVSGLRMALVQARESFAFETVFSDPVGDKLEFLREAAATGYTVVLCFVGLASVETSGQRVAMRVSQGGHDVRPEKLAGRYPRTMANLRQAIRDLPHVYVFDNEDLGRPFRKAAVFQNGEALHLSKPVPRWLVPLLPKAHK